MTPAEFKIAKPQFADVPDDTVESYIELAERFVSNDEQALILATCHLMTLDGLGTDAASKAHRTGVAEYQSIKSGNLSLTRYSAAASSSGLSYSEWLRSTPCGRQLWHLIRRTRGGPRVAYGGSRAPVSGYALDWPFPGVYPW